MNKKVLTFLLTATIAQGLTTLAMADYVPPKDANSALHKMAVKDIIVEQQDIYSISPSTTGNDSTQVASNPMRTAVTIWVNHQSNTYAIGDHLIINAKAKQTGYLTLIDVGTSGKIRQLFPNKFQPNNYVKKGDIIKIPADNNDKFQYRVSGPTGTELIKAFITKDQGSIYGQSQTTFNDELFPLTNKSSELLSKDIITELNTHHNNHWGEYNKVIYIVKSGSHAVSAPTYQINNEQALKLNRTQIRDIQRHLRMAGYYKGKIDGAIGKGTRKAIRAWQRAKGLPVTGYIDAKSYSLIMTK